MIKEDTILSSFDKKLTLLQWLKALDKNITELREKGVKTLFKKYTGAEFVKEFIDKGICIDTCVIETDSYLMILSGQFEIYSINGSAASRNCFGILVQIDKTSSNRWAYDDYFFDFTQDEAGNYQVDDVEGNEDYSTFVLTGELNDTVDRIYKNIEEATDLSCFTTKLIPNFSVKQALRNTTGRVGYGIGNCIDKVGNTDLFVGRYQLGASLNDLFTGFIIKGDEIYYSTGKGTINTFTGEIENAISGTELKEAVRRATQKVYWHSVRIQGANGSFSFNMPSTLNTPVGSIQDLMMLHEGDKWEGFGKYNTNFLLEIDLSTAEPEFTTDSGASVGLAQLGTLTITDEVNTIGG